MKWFASVTKLILITWTVSTAFAARAESPLTVHFRDGIDAAFSFTEGPFASARGDVESVAQVVIAYGSRDGRLVRGIEFDATLAMGQYTNSLSHRQVPRVAPRGPNGTWQIRNIFFTMDRKWEGKLTLKYDDGTAETQRFSFQVGLR